MRFSVDDIVSIYKNVSQCGRLCDYVEDNVEWMQPMCCTLIYIDEAVVDVSLRSTITYKSGTKLWKALATCWSYSVTALMHRD